MTSKQQFRLIGWPVLTKAFKTKENPGESGLKNNIPAEEDWSRQRRGKLRVTFHSATSFTGVLCAFLCVQIIYLGQPCIKAVWSRMRCKCNAPTKRTVMEGLARLCQVAGHNVRVLLLYGVAGYVASRFLIPFPENLYLDREDFRKIKCGL